MMTLSVTFKDPLDAQSFKSALNEINERNSSIPIYSEIEIKGYNVSCYIPSEVDASMVMPLIRASAVAINF